MATRVHRPLKVIAFNANGIGRQRCELSKQLQDLHVFFFFWFVRLLALRPLLAYCASLG
jgi:hypothetical protein